MNIAVDRLDLLQRGPLTSEDDAETGRELQDSETSTVRIRCPLCSWQPTATSLWCCSDCDWPEYFQGGCDTAWNTFETRGVCPGCAHQWIWTNCLNCQGWARHEEWYETEVDA